MQSSDFNPWQSLYTTGTKKKQLLENTLILYITSQLRAKMRVSLHTVICCCVFTTVVPLIRGDPGEPHGTQKKRFKEWLQSYMSRDLHAQLTAAKEQSSVGPSLNKDGETSLQPASFGGNIRSKRSSGCRLSTCGIHYTAEAVYKHSLPKPCSPKKKTGRDGYGRRRRSVDDILQLSLQTKRPATSSEAEQDNSNQNQCSMD